MTKFSGPQPEKASACEYAGKAELESLKREVEAQRKVILALQDNQQRLRSLATISADWYWEQDSEYRFTCFFTEQNSGMIRAALLDGAVGACPWELTGVMPMTSPWDAHRETLDARQPFRDFEYKHMSENEPPRYFSVSGVPLFDDKKQFIGYRGTTRNITKRIRSEETQRQAVRLLDDIVDNIPIAFHLTSVQNYKIVLWNKAAEALYGVSREEAVGHSVHDLWPKEYADRMHEADEELVKQGVMHDFPDRITHTRHRGSIHVHMRKVLIQDADGRPTHILITAEDITLRLEAETRLRQSDAKFRSLTELSSDWYWEMDHQLRFTLLSGDKPERTKATAEKFLGKTRWETTGVDGNQAFWVEHRKQLEHHETFRNFEYAHQDSDGLRIVSISGEPILDADGGFKGYRGVGSDITERKQTEIALRASEARFRTVVAAMAEGVLLRDGQGRVVDGNASAERVLGRSLQHMKGETFIDSSWQMLREDGSYMPDEERPITVSVRTGLPQSNVVIGYRRPDDSVFWALLNVQPLYDESSKAPSGYVTTITDITQRKRAETEIVRLNVELENRVLRRTAQLEAANTELEAFSYSVAHDLRSPLSSIDGYSALLQKALSGTLDSRSSHYLVRIREGVRRMGDLTDGLLSLAKLSRTGLNWETVDLSAEAGKIVAQLRENEPTRSIQISVEPAILVRADKLLLRQVLENLIANGWKFSSKKSSTQISVGRLLADGDEPSYFVRDNGAGFDMAYMDKLFGTFQRLHSPGEFAGTGIGLATVKRIVMRHGGRIWAKSVVGEGSTFYFTLGSDLTNVLLKQSSKSDEITGRITLAQAPRALPQFNNQATPVRNDAAVPNDVDDISLDNDKQFSNAFEHAAIGMALIATDSKRLRVNSAFCKMLGYSEAEMLSRTIHEITHPEDIEWDLVQRGRALSGEIETYQWEKRYIHRSGAVVWGHLTCSLVRDADRKPLHFIMQVQDVTERKLTESVLRESEERFRTLTALASDWFWEQDQNFRFIQVSGNAGDESMSGDARGQAMGKTPWELDHVLMPESVWDRHKSQLMRHEVFRDFEVTRLDRDGQMRYVSISGVPIFDAAGLFKGYRGTGRDTTEMRRVNEALRLSEAQLRDITDTLPAIISYVDAEQRFRFHNRPYAEGLGLSRDQINGRTMVEVLGQEGYELALPWIKEVLSGYPVSFERHRKTPQGDFRDFIVNYFPCYGEGKDEGKVIGFYSLGTDVTELKRIDRMKTEFLTTVSHELRLPLMSILGSLNSMSGGIVGRRPEDVSAAVEFARKNCERLLQLIKDIVDLKKVEATNSPR